MVVFLVNTAVKRPIIRNFKDIKTEVTLKFTQLNKKRDRNGECEAHPATVMEHLNCTPRKYVGCASKYL
jgi:hypothetical protein